MTPSTGPPSARQAEIRVAVRSDAAAAATLHAQEISEGFLPTLGVEFLTCLYRRIIREPKSFLLVAEDGGELVGMVSGTEDVGALYRAFLVRDGLLAAWLAGPRLLRSRARIVETLRYPTIERELPRAELLSVAVRADARGRGLGRALVTAANEELVRRGVVNARVVVGADNAVALGLYQKTGFNPKGRVEVHARTPSQVLTWS